MPRNTPPAGRQVNLPPMAVITPEMANAAWTAAASALTGALLLAYLWPLLDLDPLTVQLFIESLKTAELAAWMTAAAAAVWGVFSLCRFICAGIVNSFDGGTAAQRLLSTAAAGALAAGTAGGNLLYGVVFSVALTIMAAGTGRRGERSGQPHTSGS